MRSALAHFTLAVTTVIFRKPARKMRIPVVVE
jgi:hypothetical protein